MSNNSTEDLIAAVNVRAIEVLDVPVDQREGHYAKLRLFHLQSSRLAGWPVERAIEITNKMDEWIRMAVADIEAHGGYNRGTA